MAMDTTKWVTGVPAAAAALCFIASLVDAVGGVLKRCAGWIRRKI